MKAEGIDKNGCLKIQGAEVSYLHVITEDGSEPRAQSRIGTLATITATITAELIQPHLPESVRLSTEMYFTSLNGKSYPRSNR